MPLERLTGEDARILALESARVAGHTCKVLVLDPPGIDLARLRAHVTGRLGAAPPDPAPPPPDGWTPAPARGTRRLLAAGAQERAAALGGGAVGAARTAASPAAWASAVTEAARLPGTLARELRRDSVDSPLD